MYLPCRLHLMRCHIIQCRSCHIAPHRSCKSHIGWDQRCGLHIAGPNPLKGFHHCNCPSKKFSQKSPKFLLKRCVTLCLRFSLKKSLSGTETMARRVSSWMAEWQTGRMAEWENGIITNGTTTIPWFSHYTTIWFNPQQTWQRPNPPLR